ncbi:hypothetical protein L9F63_025682 [Diploptera punctata]|uniref:Uncharacterized protein n=1 Tax=Diploptera punctata TaxID=6984 RepID=A0AAD8E2X6_DIPPU|nr:hypothetical protein L9F63_025682 [Diploptera punctata]
MNSSSDMAAESVPVRKQSRSLVDEVVAVLSNVDDTRDAARDRVVKIVEDLELRLEEAEAKLVKLQEENVELQQMCHEHGIRRYVNRINHIAEVRRPIKRDPDLVGGRHTRAPSSTGGSPVSVITSPPPVIKSEPASSE